MQIALFYAWRILGRIFRSPTRRIDNFLCWLNLFLNNVDFSNVQSCGVPKIRVARGGSFKIGTNFRINNTIDSNPIGRGARSLIVVGPGAKLLVGNNVGMSSSTIVCHHSVSIGDNVKVGGNVVIYDTDFHSLNSQDRTLVTSDIDNTTRKAVTIHSNVFLGAHSTILKGVEIGRNSIVGACSVVTRDIPENEIWAGNPAKKVGTTM